ncbi:MAG: hypothetical protein ACJA1B_001414 [Polaribacter sp.]|jgi:hypothetical protein
MNNTIIKVKTLSDSIIEGFLLSHQRNLPKNSNLITVEYEVSKEGLLMNTINIYKCFLKRGAKTYIIRNKF